MEQNEELRGAVFCIGSCNVSTKLRMENEEQSIPAGQDVIIGFATKHNRGPDDVCAICYYDSASSESEAEKELNKPTVVPVGRYASLCICTETSPSNADDNVDDELDVEVVPTPICSHTFHTGCIYKWLKADNGGFSCPICRGGLEKQRLLADDVPNLYQTAPEFVVVRWPNGNLKSEHFELNKVKHGVSKTYTNNGQLEWKCNYVNGRKNGTEAYYYPESGTLKSTTEYRDDIKHGLCQRFATDGRPIGESHWDDGKRSGRNIEWYTVDGPDGQPRICNLEHHLNGEKHGIAMKWAFNGKLTMYGVYNNGQRNGRFCAWFEETGALRLKEYFIDGIRDGRSVEYYDSKINNQRNPKEISYYRHGMRYGPHQIFWSNGQKKLETEYNDLGQEDGVHREWNRFGMLYKVLYYDSGKLDGVCQAFDEGTGALLETETYKQGVLHGLSVQRYKGVARNVLATPRFVRMFKNGTEILTRHYTRQGRIVWEKLPDGTVNQPVDDTIHIQHQTNSRGKGATAIKVNIR